MCVKEAVQGLSEKERGRSLGGEGKGKEGKGRGRTESFTSHTRASVISTVRIAMSSPTMNCLYASLRRRWMARYLKRIGKVGVLSGKQGRGVLGGHEGGQKRLLLVRFVTP